MKILIKNCKIIDPSIKLNKVSDVLIENGIISNIGEINVDDAKIIEAEGKILTPGFFDMHVHLREPGREDEETITSGTESAMVGGFTGIACMPNTDPTIDSAEVVSLIKDKNFGNIVDVFPIGAVTKNRKGENLSPILELLEAGVVGFSDDGTVVKSAAILRKALEYTKEFNVPIIEHCEDLSMADGVMNEGLNSTMLGLPAIPSIAEDLIVMRDIMIAEYVGGKVHIAHISTKNAVELVRNAKAKGINITAEVTPHHFSLTDDLLKTYDTNYKMNPPLRSKEDVEAILEGLQDGTIDCIATDHAPHSIEEKEMEFIYAPNGIIGLETAIGLAFNELVHKKILSIEQLIEKFAINPRKILNIEIPKIEVGKKANLTLLDPEKIWTVQVSDFKSKSKNSPFDKKLLTGKAIGVFNNNMAYINGKIIK
ncbi:MAG TPA: dihydroorotase [Melioribacteraceae bacterium]|nr:dihydroorotase [Melioribacteraceae bacterium]